MKRHGVGCARADESAVFFVRSCDIVTVLLMHEISYVSSLYQLNKTHEVELEKASQITCIHLSFVFYCDHLYSFRSER